MSRSKTTDGGVKYSREALLRSKALAGYQPDFAAVILKEAYYTIEEAKAALDTVLKKGAD